MITDKPIKCIEVEVPETVARKNEAVITINVLDDSGNPVDAVVPVEVIITDSTGRKAEYSGYYGTVGGVLQVTYQVASNDCAGVWQVKARELASGCTQSAYFRVN
jgi:hypothetical protein